MLPLPIAVTTAAFLGISKVPTVNFEINSFSFYLLKKIFFPKFVPQEVELKADFLS